jgi:cellobiose dehydrogenase (acceptor)
MVFPTSTTGNEFIAEFIVPVTDVWAGVALGPVMAGYPLIMGWPYNGGFVSSTRFTDDYTYPYPYAGPIITTLPAYSKTNSTHWTWVFRCQNCTCEFPGRTT